MSPRLGRALSGAGSVPQQAAAAALAAQQQQQRLQQRAAATSAAASPAGPASFSPSSAGSSGGGAGSSGAVTGREVPAHTALMRRPSWSARSSYGGLPGEASQQGVGYSGAALGGQAGWECQQQAQSSSTARLLAVHHDVLRRCLTDPHCPPLHRAQCPPCKTPP